MLYAPATSITSMYDDKPLSELYASIDISKRKMFYIPISDMSTERKKKV